MIVAGEDVVTQVETLMFLIKSSKDYIRAPFSYAVTVLIHMVAAWFEAVFALASFSILCILSVALPILTPIIVLGAPFYGWYKLLGWIGVVVYAILETLVFGCLVCASDKYSNFSWCMVWCMCVLNIIPMYRAGLGLYYYVRLKFRFVEVIPRKPGRR